MIKKQILVRFGDLMLKGKNKNVFIKQVNSLIKDKLKGTDAIIIKEHDRIYIDMNNEPESEIIRRLQFVSGLYSFSIVYVALKTIDDIVEKGIEIIENEVNNLTTFKIETKRSDKKFYLTSQEITGIVSPQIVKHFKDRLKVDVRTPKNTLRIEIRNDAAYLYVESIKAMGGYPVGTLGKGLVMMSGGIDSPVSAYLAIKQGIEVELLHFESTPLTPLESVQKVIDLAKVLSDYLPKSKIKVHLVPFKDIHEKILTSIHESYLITIMRRIMYTIAERFANKNNILCLVNGESVGQVASQTLESINVVENVTRIPIIRPVVTYDKQDIINISKKINTYDISIRPFNDCCTVYIPKHPVTRPKLKNCLTEEEKIPNLEELIDNAISNIKTVMINRNLDFEIYNYGFDVKEAVNNYYNKEKEV